MGFFDDLGKKVVDAGQKTVQKTKEMSDITHINSLINQEVNKTNSMYYQIGKLYIDIHGKDCEEEFLEMVNAVTASEQAVREYKKQIQNIRGVQCCKQCGAEVPIGMAFCSSCGNIMPEVTTQRNADDYVKCPDCGNWVEIEARFCTSCGRLMAQSQNSVFSNVETSSEIAEKHCPNCGAKLAGNFAFCTECGTKL